MTILKRIKTTNCPVCGAEAVSDRRDPHNTHINGVVPERRKFACNYEIEFLGNFNKETPAYKTKCSRDPKIIKSHQRCVDATEAVENLIATFKLTKDEHNEVVDRLKKQYFEG